MAFDPMIEYLRQQQNYASQLGPLAGTIGGAAPLGFIQSGTQATGVTQQEQVDAPNPTLLLLEDL